MLGDLLAKAPDRRAPSMPQVWTRGRQAGITPDDRSFALLKAKRISTSCRSPSTSVGNASAEDALAAVEAGWPRRVAWVSHITLRALLTN